MLKITTMLVLFLSGMANAQVTENRTVSGFNKITVQDGVELIYTQGNTLLSVSADNTETLKNLVTEVKDNELRIYQMNENMQAEVGTIKIYLTADNICRFKANTKATITMTSPIYTKDVTIDLNSGAKFIGTIKTDEKIVINTGKETELNLKADAHSLDGNFKSGSRVNLCGTVKNVSIYTFGNAYCLSRNLLADNVTIKAEDNSKVLIHTKEKINITIVDTAKVTFTGSPNYAKWNDNAYVTMTDKNNNDKTVTLNHQNTLPSSSKHCFNQEKSK